MRTAAIIPARMGSSRFPGKPLAPLRGHPMVLHVYARARMCASLDEVYVATPDAEIQRAAEAYGAPVIMTRPDHERCNDRVAEAAAKLPEDIDIVVNIQGDEPMLYAGLVDDGVRLLRAHPRVVSACPVAAIPDDAILKDPTVAKVVRQLDKRALYITRSPVPSSGHSGGRYATAYQLVVVFTYRRDFLHRLARMPQSPLEQAESIDYLRIIENGYDLQTFDAPRTTISVDTPQDLRAVDEALNRDELTPRVLAMLDAAKRGGLR